MQVAKGLFEFKSSGQAQVALEEHKTTQKTRKGGKWAERTGFQKDDKAASDKWQGHGIGTALADIKDIHEHLDKFLMHRLGIRVVLGQYLALKPIGDEDVNRHLPRHSMNEMDEVGLIKLAVRPAELASAAYEDAKTIFERQFPEYDTPELILQGNTAAEIAYVPHHLYYILFELIKNSFQATAMNHGASGSEESDLPPVRVIIGDSVENEDIVIKVSDEGGGIPRSHTKRIFSYLFTTAQPVFPILDSNDLESFGRNSPLAGLGYGLPIARLYARYFGGDLHIISVEGFGTDAFLYLHKLGDQEEPLA